MTEEQELEGLRAYISRLPPSPGHDDGSNYRLSEATPEELARLAPLRRALAEKSYVVVPIQPTGAMIVAAGEAALSASWGIVKTSPERCWRVMISAFWGITPKTSSVDDVLHL